MLQSGNFSFYIIHVIVLLHFELHINPLEYKSCNAYSEISVCQTLHVSSELQSSSLLLRCTLLLSCYQYTEFY
jgi:hypothetical protein